MLKFNFIGVWGLSCGVADKWQYIYSNCGWQFFGDGGGGVTVSGFIIHSQPGLKL